MGRNINYSYYQSPFKNCTELTSLTIGNSVTGIVSNAFMECVNLLTVVSCIEEPFLIYGKIITYTPWGRDKETFSKITFENATLYIPVGTISKYEAKEGWKDFVNIQEGAPSCFTISYIIDGVLYKTYQVEVGTPIVLDAEPTKDGYAFSGWSEIPETMPAHNVTVTGSFTLVDDIQDINTDEDEYLIYTLDGKQIETLQKGVNVSRYKDGTSKKLMVK